MPFLPLEDRTLGSILVLVACVVLGGCSEPTEAPHAHDHAAEHAHDEDHDHDHDSSDGAEEHSAARGDRDDHSGDSDHEHEADHADHTDSGAAADVASVQESRRIVAELKAATADGKLSEEQLAKVRAHLESLESQLDRLDRAVEKQEQKESGHDDHDH